MRGLFLKGQSARGPETAGARDQPNADEEGLNAGAIFHARARIRKSWRKPGRRGAGLWPDFRA
jgi:hypothetical protein